MVKGAFLEESPNKPPTQISPATDTFCAFLDQQSLSKRDRIQFQVKDVVIKATLQPERIGNCLSALWSDTSPTRKLYELTCYFSIILQNLS